MCRGQLHNTREAAWGEGSPPPVAWPLTRWFGGPRYPFIGVGSSMRFRHGVISLLAISVLAAVLLCSSAPATGGSNKAVSERSCSRGARPLRALHLRPIPV